MVFLAPVLAAAAKATVAAGIQWFTAGAMLAVTVKKNTDKDKKNA